MKNTHINRDEVRRQLREADREQRASITAFRDALHRVFQSKDIPAAAKAELLGVPAPAPVPEDRWRDHPRRGGAGRLRRGRSRGRGRDRRDHRVDELDHRAAERGRPRHGRGAGPHRRLAREPRRRCPTASSSARPTSQLPAEIDFDPAVIDAATLFRDHHRAHADARQRRADRRRRGRVHRAEPVPARERRAARTWPTSPTRTGSSSFARDLENIAAGTYAYAAGVLSTPDLRQTIMSIGGVESRHATALALVLDPTGEVRRAPRRSPTRVPRAASPTRPSSPTRS